VAKPSTGVYTVGSIAVKALCWGFVVLGRPTTDSTSPPI